MTDLHSHLLYGVDDGAGDRDESRRMLELYAGSGVKRVCCTSHSGAFPGNKVKYQERFAEVSGIAESFGIELVSGLEYSLGDLLDDPAVPLGESRCFLLDTGIFQIDSALINKLMPLNVAGNSFLWAHPERLHPGKAVRNTGKYAMLRGGGCQINAASLLGYYGADVKDAAWELLESGCCAVIASDAHNAAGVEAFAKAAKLLKELYPAEAAAGWLQDNPGRILAGEFPEHINSSALSWRQRLKRLFAGK